MGRGVLAGRATGGVGVGGPDGQALGHGVGDGGEEARGPRELGARRGVLAGRAAGGVGVGGPDGQALGMEHGSGGQKYRKRPHFYR